MKRFKFLLAIWNILRSKKGIAAISGILMVVFQQFLGIDEATSTQIVALIMSYIVGQGLADFGKEKEKIELEFQREP